MKEANRSFIDQDYATLQNAIRRTAGHDWIEPINLDKGLNFLSFWTEKNVFWELFNFKT